MVEELKLEKVYGQRGIELITPAVGTRILDRLLTQRTRAVVAMSADWGRARQAGLGGRLPLLFSELGTAESPAAQLGSEGSILDVLAGTPEAERLGVIADGVRRIVAAVFDCAVTDIEPDDMLDDIGLDSMMAMDFRVRINTVFSIDLPVLEILRGVSVNAVADRVLGELHYVHGDVPTPVDEPPPQKTVADDDMDRLMDDLSDTELRQLLAELEGETVQTKSGEVSP